MKKRLRRGLKAIAEWCQRHRHDAVDSQQRHAQRELRGHYQYYGLPRTTAVYGKFFRDGASNLAHVASRRTRGRHLNWERFANSSRASRSAPA